LLPVIQLQQAWLKNGEFWKHGRYPIKAQNQGYTTVSWGIPVSVLFQAIGQCLRTEFQPAEFME
jgi:hypothetical protein